MSALLSIPDAAELLSHTLVTLKALGYASAAMIPVHQNISSEGEKPEVLPATAPEVYIAPGRQYGDADEALAHLVRELKNPERDNYNDSLDFTYASLAQLLDMLREPIYQHGLLLIQGAQTANKDTDTHTYNMVTTFRHVPTKTEVSFSTPMYIKQDKRLDDCQKMGASLTYFKRYGLREALAITDGDDDADQADSKRDRRKARSLNSQREWKPTKSPRTKPESILNMLVAAGEFTGGAVVAQAKARNPYLRTPTEVAEDVIHLRDTATDDESIAKDMVLRYGLTDTHWQKFYSQHGFFKVDGDELIDTRTGRLVSAEIAMDIAESLSGIALSTAEPNSVYDTRDMSKPLVSKAFVPDASPLDYEEKAFIQAVETGHFDEICEIAERNIDNDIAKGFDITSQYRDTSYNRRNWYNACREFYTLALMSGDVNFDALAKPELTAPRTIMDIVGANGDDEVSEATILAAQVQLVREQRIDMADEMQQKADIAREIAAGNSETDDKLQQLHGIARRCDAFTKSFIETLILHIESDGLNSETPVFVPESELPY